LNALSILLGKSTSRLLSALFLLATQLPFMLVSVTMGGLSVNQVLAGFAMLVAYAFLLANLGLLGSVLVQKTSSAAIFTGLVLGGFVFLPIWFAEQMHYSFSFFSSPSTHAEICVEHWYRATPLGRMNEILRTNFSGAIIHWHALANLLLGLGCFGLAWLFFERFALPRGEAASESSVHPQLAPQRPSLPARSRANRLPALAWKDYRWTSGGPWSPWVKFVISGGFVLLAWSSSKYRLGPESIEEMSAIVMSVCGSVLMVSLAIEAGCIFKSERQQKTLASLLTLPFSTSRIVWHKILGFLISSWTLFLGFSIGFVGLLFAWLPDFAGANVFDDGFFYACCAIAYAVLSGFLLPVFIAWLSLRLRWGALPIGGTIWLFGNWFIAVFLFLLAREGAIVLLPITALVILCTLASRIPGRLEQLAAEES
jgi:ABC-type transport system involved in multi-copper enzyme maturation permease subunit